MEKSYKVTLKPLETIKIKPSIEQYDYSPAYCLSIIREDGVEFYKFTALTPENVAEALAKHLTILLIDNIFLEE